MEKKEEMEELIVLHLTLLTKKRYGLALLEVVYGVLQMGVIHGLQIPMAYR